MSSRNATQEDFEHVIQTLQQGTIQPALFITHRTPCQQLPDVFSSLLDPTSNVIKAVVDFS